ncbi:DUF1194 domain-containing protein [Thioclava sp. GXIMD4215]|uniref:DUF1194 domain-containing protein n=1 Tax=Thioclava sp. GXIMD4215 TaxID=3131928 RepID=UPI00324354AF
MGLQRWMVAIGLALGMVPLSAQARCDLALVLALDISASIDSHEYALQKQGMARALADPRVVAAIEERGGIWLTAFEWSGTDQTFETLPWVFVDGRTTILGAAERIGAGERPVSNYPTALVYALGQAVITLRRAPETCVRQIIDIAGDGINNAGFPPRSAYGATDMSGITVNALVIEGEQPSPIPYFEAQVLHGPNAFLEIAASYQDYQQAMTRKLLREIRPASFVMLAPETMLSLDAWGAAARLPDMGPFTGGAKGRGG